MRKRYFTSIVCLTFFIALSYGQSVSFLNYFSDARTAAMGNAGYVLPSPFSVQRNMAAIMCDNISTTEAAASYLLWQPKAANSALVNVAGYTILKNLGLAAGVRYHTLDIVEKTDEQGNILGIFTPSEYTLEIGFGYTINTHIAAGISLHYINSDMGGEKKASAIASDISMLFNYEKLRVGLGCSLLGSKISYGYSDYDLPTRIHSGVAYRFINKDLHNVTGVVDAAYQLSSSYNGMIGGVGVEYIYNNLISLRSGWHVEGEKVGVSYATVGCGAHLAGFSIDFAYMFAQNNNPMRQTMIVSLKWNMMDNK